MEKRQISYLVLVLVIIVLLFQSQYSAWFRHISTDVYVYYNRADYFLEHLNLTDLNSNEHMPGAILLFISAAPALFINNSFNSYTIGFITVNTLLVLLIAYVYQKFHGEYNLIIFAIILLLTGPIIFFRFELLVILLVLVSFYFWKKQRFQTTAIILGAASLVKLYPVIFLPYLLLVIYRKSRWLGVFKTSLIYFLAVFFFLGTYLLIFQVPVGNFLFSLNFHAMKPVHTESIWAEILMFWSMLVSGYPPQLTSAWGINGLAQQFWLLPLWFYNYIWVLPTGLLYIWLSKRIVKAETVFDVRICIAVVLLFLIFSKVLSHQYLLWFLLLIPLMDIKVLLSKYWTINIFLALLATFLYQYIYPLNYDQYLSNFSNPGGSPYIFIMFITHLLLIMFFLRLIFELKITYKQ